MHSASDLHDVFDQPHRWDSKMQFSQRFATKCLFSSRRIEQHGSYIITIFAAAATCLRPKQLMRYKLSIERDIYIYISISKAISIAISISLSIYLSISLSLYICKLDLRGSLVARNQAATLPSLPAQIAAGGPQKEQSRGVYTVDLYMMFS